MRAAPNKKSKDIQRQYSGGQSRTREDQSADGRAASENPIADRGLELTLYRQRIVQQFRPLPGPKTEAAPRSPL